MPPIEEEHQRRGAVHDADLLVVDTVKTHDFQPVVTWGRGRRRQRVGVVWWVDAPGRATQAALGDLGDRQSASCLAGRRGQAARARRLRAQRGQVVDELVDLVPP